MSVKSQVVNAIRWTAAARIGSQVVTWAITLVVIRLLSPEDYGLMAMAMALIGFCLLINELGVVPAFVQRKEIDDHLTRQVFGFVLLLNLAICAAIFVGAPVYAGFFGEERLVDVLRVLALSLLVLAFGSVPAALFTRNIEFREISIVEFAANIVGGFATLGFALGGAGVWSLVAGHVALAVVRTAGIVFMTRFRLFPVFRFTGLGSMFAFGAKVSAQRIIWYFGGQLDVILIGKLLGKTPLGLYSVGFHLASMPMQKVMGLANQVAFPAFSRLQDDLPRVKSYFLQTTGLFSLVFFPVMWGLAMVAQDVVAVFLGPKWDGAAVVLQVLCLAIPFRLSLNLWPALIDALGRPGLNLENKIIEFAIMACGIVIGLQWGVEGAAVGVGCAYVAAWAWVSGRCLPLIQASRVEHVSRQLPAALSAGTMAAAIYVAQVLALSDVAPGLRLGVEIALGAAVYGGLTYAINREAMKKAIALIANRG